MAAPTSLVRVSGRRLLRDTAAVLGLVAALFGIGFGWFVIRSARAPPLPDRADAIVVLTGGAGRVEYALHLLAEGRAERLLVSGAGLAARTGVDAPLAGRVTLGRGARSTRGNALETAEWVRARGVTTLIVVTSGYHMPRALLELGRTLPPEVAVHVAPLLPHAADGHDRVPVRLLLAEYAKFLGAAVGLSALAVRDAESAAPPLPREAR